MRRFADHRRYVSAEAYTPDHTVLEVAHQQVSIASDGNPKDGAESGMLRISIHAGIFLRPRHSRQGGDGSISTNPPDCVIAAIGNKERSIPSDGDSRGVAKERFRAGAIAKALVAQAARKGRHIAIGPDFADRVIASHKDVAGSVYRNSFQQVKLRLCFRAVDCPGNPGCAGKRTYNAISRHLADGFVFPVCDQEDSRGVAGHAHRSIELRCISLPIRSTCNPWRAGNRCDCPAWRDLSDHLVFSIRYEKRPVVVDGYSLRATKPRDGAFSIDAAWTPWQPSECRDDSLGRNLADRVVPRVHDKAVALAIDGQPRGTAEPRHFR